MPLGAAPEQAAGLQRLLPRGGDLGDQFGAHRRFRLGAGRDAKAALFGASLGRECERRLAGVFQNSGNAADLATALRDIGTRFIDMVISPEGLAIERSVMAEARRFPELAEAFFAAGPARAIARMAALLAARTETGDLDIADAEFAAEQFFMLCQTRTVMRTRLGLPLKPGDAARGVSEAVDVFLRAYKSK